MHQSTQQLLSLVAGVVIALIVWAITHWRQLQLDWKSEIRALLAPVALAAAGMLASGMAWDDALAASLTMLATAVGLNRSVSTKESK